MFLVPFIIEHTIDHLYTFSFVLKDNVSINGLIVILKNISQCDVKHIMTSFLFSVLCFFVLFVFVLCLVYPMLPVFSGLSILDCPLVFSRVRVTGSLVLYVCFVDRCLSFGHCVLSVLLRYMDSDCPFGIFELFLSQIS
jgi:hypothetical protein